MLSLSLISEKLKQEIKLKRIYSLTKKMSFLFIFITIIISAILWGARFVLLDNFNEINRRTNLTRMNGENFNLKAQEINNKLSTVSKIQNEFVSYSQLIKTLTEEIPPGITLNYFKVDSGKQLLKIRGHASNRDILLKLKEDLSKLPVLTDVILPLSDILEKTNINFEINIKLDLSKLADIS